MAGSSRSRPNVPHQSRDNAVDANTVLIEWTSAIYGIFWGVWLGFFSEQLITQCNMVPVLSAFPVVKDVVNILYPGMLAGISLLIVVYSYFLVRWLWGMRRIVPNSGYQEVFQKLGTALVFWLASVVGLFILGGFCAIRMLWVWVGIWATLSWLVVITFVVLADKDGWV